MENGQTNWIKTALQLGVAGVICLAALGALLKINVNDITHLEAAVVRQTEAYTETQRDTNEALRGVTTAIELNTEVLRTLSR